MNDQLFFVFDVESVGLTGEGFAFGYVVIDQEGNELDSMIATSDPDNAFGTADDREWITANVTPAVIDYVPKKRSIPMTDRLTAHEIRNAFWDVWRYWKGHGAIMAAEVPWPVEARFLSACIDDDRRRAANGPYPLLDIASVRFAAGLDPLATVERLPDELPAHNPLADARQSARLLIEALDLIEKRKS